jgi:hypothetical protein
MSARNARPGFCVVCGESGEECRCHPIERSLAGFDARELAMERLAALTRILARQYAACGHRAASDACLAASERLIGSGSPRVQWEPRHQQALRDVLEEELLARIDGDHKYLTARVASVDDIQRIGRVFGIKFDQAYAEAAQ